MRMPKTLGAFASLLVLSCGGSPKPAPTPTPRPDQPSHDVAPPLPVEKTPTDPTVKVEMTPKVDHPPEVMDIPYTKVGVGQMISFGTTAVDQDLDETRTEITKMPASAKWDAITQTVSWTPTKADIGKQDFVLKVTQPKGTALEKTWTIEVTAKKQVLPVAEQQSAIIETVLMIRQPKRLEAVNKDWPLDKMLLFTGEHFGPQFAEEKRKGLTAKLDKGALFNQFLQQFSVTQNNARLDPKSPQFDKAAFGNPADWKIVSFRPRIDRQWTELRVVYQAVKAPEPVFAMFRIRPVVEYVPALPRPTPERDANNKVFLGLVAKYFLPKGAPSADFLKDQAKHGKAVAAFMNEFMGYKDEAQPYTRTFSIGIAIEARMGGGSTRNEDGSYKSGDGWAWSAQKPFISLDDPTTQSFQNVIIPGFWTKTVPSEDGSSWVPQCGPRWAKGSKTLAPGHEILCRPTLGFVDLPDMTSGKVKGSRIDANNLFIDHKNVYMQVDFPLDDGRRDVGEENGMTCSQCHIRNFGMHDYTDAANTDPKAGIPTSRNKKIATLNFQIIPTWRWEEFTLEFLKHQECRAKQNYAQYVPDQGTGLTCPFTATASN